MQRLPFQLQLYVPASVHGKFGHTLQVVAPWLQMMGVRDTLTRSVVRLVSSQVPLTETVTPVIKAILADRITLNHISGMIVELGLRMQGLVTMADMQAITGTALIVQMIGRSIRMLQEVYI